MLINLKLVFVVVNFFTSGNFFLFDFGMVMYANKVETKEKIKIPWDKKIITCNIYVKYSFRQKVLKLFPGKKFLFKILDFSL